MIKSFGGRSLVKEEVDFDDFYEIKRLKKLLKGLSYRRIALQFPDTLLADAPYVCHTLQMHLTEDIDVSEADISKRPALPIVFLLADTTYAPCCVDVTAAQKYHADCIVHFGHSCQSAIASEIPIIFVFGRIPLSLDILNEAIRLELEPHITSIQSISVLLVFDDCFQYQFLQLLQRLRQSLDPTYSNFFVTIPYYTFNIQQQESDVWLLPLVADPWSIRSRDVLHYGKTVGAPWNASHGGSSVCGRQLVRVCYADATETIQLIPVLGGFSEILDSHPVKIVFVGRREVEGFDGSGHSIVLNPLLQRLLLCYGSEYSVVSFDTSNCNSHMLDESTTVEDLVMRRYGYIERVRDAETIGILHGSLSLSGHRELYNHLNHLLEAERKKAHSIVVGKLNVPKLENFSDVDAFCIIACPEQSVVNCKAFSRKIIAPYELEIALCTRDWNPSYILDFNELLKTNEAINKEEEGGVTKDLALLHHQNTHNALLRMPINDAFIPMKNRTFKGVEPVTLNIPPTLAIEGKRGIASSYENEYTPIS